MAFWIPLAMATMSAAQGLQQQGAAKAARIADESNTRVNNIIRESNNILAAASGSLSRYMQSRQNQVHLKNTGKELEAITTNMLRLQDAAQTGTLERRIAAAEEAGALSASVGAAGIGGGTVQMLNSTMNLRSAMVEQLARTEQKQQQYDMNLARESTKEQMILGLSDVQFLDNINMMEYQSRNIQVPSTASVFGNAALTFMKFYSQLGGSFGGGDTSTTYSVAQGASQSDYTGPAFSNWIKQVRGK